MAAGGRASAGDAAGDLLPFALLAALVDWQREIRIGASLLVVGFGLFRLVNRRHPRVLARIPPTQLALWSFAVAMAHGAGLMLVPIYLGLCRAAGLDSGHQAAGTLINANLGMAVLVAVVHPLAMVAAGGARRGWSTASSGLKFVSRSWFNLGCRLGGQPDPGRRHRAGAEHRVRQPRPAKFSVMPGLVRASTSLLAREKKKLGWPGQARP